VLLRRCTVTPPEMYNCGAARATAQQSTTSHGGPPAAAVATADASAPRFLYVLGPAAFDPSDDDALSCPLTITADQGQHINLTLYDFGVASRPARRDNDYSGYEQVRAANTQSLKNVLSLASCSFHKRGLILIISSKQHQHTFRNNVPIQLSLSLHFC